MTLENLLESVKQAPLFSTSAYARKRPKLESEVNGDKDSTILPQTPSMAEASYEKNVPSSAATSFDQPSPSPKRKPSVDLKPDTEDPASKAKASLEDLEDLIESVFEADDDNADDTSDIKRAQSNVWLVSDDVTSEPLLSNDIEGRLESALRRAIVLNVYNQIQLDDILRLQKLCLRSIKKAGEIAWGGLEGLKNRSEHENVGLFSIIENGLKACKTVLRSMLSPREEKQIFSEDAIKDIVELLSNLVDNLLVPLISPVDDSGQLISYKKFLCGILQDVTRNLSLLYQLLSLQDLSESITTRLEFVCIALIFVENLTKEKDSLLGSSNIENLRVAAMDVIAQIFASYTDQRTFVLSEILASLEKLPVSRLSARQYRLVTGGNIQLVTALIVRLVQMAGSIDTSRISFNQSINMTITDMTPDEIEIESRDRTEFVELCQKANNEATKSATDVVNFLVERAMKSTKSGDAPYRVLLDLFTEDFICVLDLPEWPGTEVLLRCLAMRMISSADPEQYGAQINSMALDVLGVIGVKLLTLHLQTGPTFDLGSESTPEGLAKFDTAMTDILTYLHKTQAAGSSSKSSYNCFLTTWASLISSAQVENTGQVGTEIIRKLLRLATDEQWTIKENFVSETPGSIKLKYAQFLRYTSLYKLYDRVLAEILRSLDNPRIITRTKGLRVLNMLLAKDPSILINKNVLSSVAARLRDSSPQVRDAAVDIVGKYMLIKPVLIQEFYMMLCDRAGDTGTGVRRRVVKLLKDVYQITQDLDIKVEIADKLLKRTEDVDPGVQSLAKKNLIELWLGPITANDDLSAKTDIDGRLKILIRVRERNEKLSRLLVMLIQDVDSRDGDLVTVQHCNAASMAMVESLFQSVSDANDVQSFPLYSLVGLLSVFAIANPGLFSVEQVRNIHMYLEPPPLSQDGGVNGEKENMLPYYVLIILHHVLPTTGTLATNFTGEVLNVLLSRLSKFNLRELSEAMPCLWHASVILKQTVRLAVTATSCLKLLGQYWPLAVSGKLTAADAKLVRLLHLLGYFGRYCELTEHSKMFNDALNVIDPTRRRKTRQDQEATDESNTVKLKNSARKAKISEAMLTPTNVIVMVLRTFTLATVNGSIRRTAVRNIGMVGIAHPQVFVSDNVLAVLDAVFQSHDRELKDTVVKVLSEFLTHEQKKADEAIKERGHGAEKVDIEVLQGNTLKFANDGVCASLVQKYLNGIMEITLESEDEFALAGILLMEKVVKQGFPNPRTCIPTLIALETSSKEHISGVAQEMHQRLHDKHESLIEGGYVDGLRQAAEYNQRLARAKPDRAECRHGLERAYAVVKANRVTRRKFLIAVAKSLDFDTSRHVGRQALAHLAYVRFVVPNVADLEFTVTEEPHYVIQALDRIVTSTGMTVLYAITDMQSRLARQQQHQVKTDEEEQATMLSTIATQCAIVYAAWQLRQHLKKQYNLVEQACRQFMTATKSGKELRPVTRAANVERLELAFFCLQDEFEDRDQNLIVLDTVKEILVAADYS
ncbi:sister chromatid cohesion C-terminus-domain-containing protein [Lipomyces japonicus]|uniref:sister chromatid cohesion C-terminus-domain-containing protein n=1 Tax=Lipomyces japonicus TaxID=56871 RepID=UPI0034CD54E2